MQQNSDQPENNPASLVPLLPVPLFPDEIQARVRSGCRCVRFVSCLSAVFFTVRRESPVYLTTSWADRYIRSTRYTLLSLLLGPWAVPWGVVWTAKAVWTNLTGGLDVTDEVLREIGPTPGGALPPTAV